MIVGDLPALFLFGIYGEQMDPFKGIIKQNNKEISRVSPIVHLKRPVRLSFFLSVRCKGEMRLPAIALRARLAILRLRLSIWTLLNPVVARVSHTQDQQQRAFDIANY